MPNLSEMGPNFWAVEHWTYDRQTERHTSFQKPFSNLRGPQTGYINRSYIIYTEAPSHHFTQSLSEKYKQICLHFANFPPNLTGLYVNIKHKAKQSVYNTLNIT